MAGEPGRPTKLTPFLMDVAEDYIENFSEVYGHAVPSIEGLSLVVGVARSSLHLWAADNVDARFSDIFEKLAARQIVELQKGGLYKVFSGPITALLLSKHGYHTKTDVTNSDGSLRPQVTEVVRRVVSKNDNQ